MRTDVAAAVAVLAIAAAGLVVWRVVGPPPVGPEAVGSEAAADVGAASRPGDGLPEQLAELRQLLEDEREARLQLTARVERLGDRLAARDALTTAGASESADPEDGAQVTVVGGDAASAQAPDDAPRGAFDTGTLVAAGLTPGEAVWLHERWEQRQLAELYLADRAARERWGFRRLARERAAARGALQDEIGMGMYDAMLYAAGDHNRVSVRDVYAGSAADGAGVRVGDYIVRYANSAVFGVDDLRRLTREGETGEFVSIEVERGGGVDRLQIERGPLGVLLGRERVEPRIE
jgi:hypothetical protein